MKRLTTNHIAKALDAANTTFREPLFSGIAKIVRTYAPELDEINAALGRQHRRHLDHEDVARIAYVHLRSIKENDGASPVDRIIAYLAANGIAVDKTHVKAATDILIDIGLIALVEAEDRKAKRCRRYAVTPDAAAILAN